MTSASRPAQLGEPSDEVVSLGSVLDGTGQELDDVVIEPKGREVLERKVDGASDGSCPAEVAERFELALAARHLRHATLKGGYRSVTSVTA